MSDTTITSRQVRDGTLIRADINTTITGSALITKVLAGDAINLSSSGVDTGTGDVTINVTGAVPLSTTNFDKILSPSEDTVQKAFDVIDDLKHSELDELNADDHSQYILVAGTRAFTGDQSLGGNKITNLGNPTNANDGVNKSYVDSKVQGLDWQESVLDKDLTSPPGSPSSGDRYIVGVGATGAWSGYDNYIAEYTTSWSFINPDQGFSTWVEDEDKLYVYDGSTWIKFGSTISHDTLSGLLDDDHTQYLRTDGTRQLTGNWDIGNGRIILGDEIRARSTSGLKLTENSGLGIDIQNTTGNIGLGISSPNYRLHLHKTDSSQNYIQFTNSTTGSGSANGFLIGFDASEIGKIWHSENKPIEFGTNALLRMTIAADGTIGIGRAPSYTLDINGTLNLQTGTSINEFSIDGTLAGDSDDAVPTEKAVKTYADGIIPTQTGNDDKFLSTNGSVLSWEDVDAFPDQTGNDGQFLTTDGTNVNWAVVDALPDQTGNTGKFLTTDGLDASWEIINEISKNDSKISIIDSTSVEIITIQIDGLEKGQFNINGFQLESGTNINEFSTNTTLSEDSDDIVPTQKAIKKYIDTSGVISGYIRQWRDDEPPNGLRTEYNLSYTPISATEYVYIDNLLGEPGINFDYTLDDNTITTIRVLSGSERLRVTYIYFDGTKYRHMDEIFYNSAFGIGGMTIGTDFIVG